MTFNFGVFPSILFIVVMVCWFVFAAILLKRRKLERTADARRDRASDFGLILQLISYVVLFVREPFGQIPPNARALDWLFGALAMVLSIGSVWLIANAIDTLGREWSVKARLIEGHRLATTGPYRFVRHPLYTGMLGMLVATGLAIGQWQLMLVAVVIFMIGTMIRIRSEERLLRGAFGIEFDNYSRRVSAIIPFII